MKPACFFATAMLLLSWSGCIIIDDDDTPFGDCLDGRGNIITTVYELSPYDEVELLGDVDIILSQQAVPAAEMRAYENLVDEVGLQASGGRLIIDTRRCINAQDRPQLFLSNAAYTKISNSGAGDIFGDNTFETADIQLSNFGSGDINLGLLAQDVEVLLTGSGDVLLDGESDKLKLSITGSGDFQGFGLATRQAGVLITGSGDAEVLVLDFLEATLTGSGNVFFKGNPTIDATITGSGRLVDSN